MNPEQKQVLKRRVCLGGVGIHSGAEGGKMDLV